MKLINLFLFLFLLGCVSCKSPEENIPQRVYTDYSSAKLV